MAIPAGLLAGICGVGVALLAAATPELFLSADDTLYLAIDTSVLSGRGLVMPDGSPVLFRPPLYALSLLPGYALGGLDGALATNLLVGAVAAALVFLLGRTVGGHGAGRLGGGLVGILAVVLAFAELPTLRLVHSLRIDLPMSAVVLAAALLTVRLAQRPNRGFSMALGVALGMAVLVKLTALAFVPVPLVVAWWARPDEDRLRRLEGVAVAYLVAALVMIPWWLWVWLTNGSVWLVPGRFAGPVVVAVVALGLAVAGLLGWLCRTPHRPLIVETLARASGPGAATLAVGLAIAWSLALVAALFATEGIQDPTLPLRAAARFARNQYSPFLWPLALPLLAWVAALWRLRHRRPADLAVTAGLLAFAPVVIYSGLNFYDARSGLAFVLFSAVLEAAFVVEAVAWLRRRVSDDVGGSVGRRLRSPAVAVGLAGLLIGGLVGGYAVRLVTHLAADFTDVDEAGATARAKFDWRRAPAVAPVTEWLESNVPSGSTVMISWLYGTELYRQTEGRFVMPYVPTVTLDIPSEGALLRPRDTGRRFLDASFDPAAVGADLLWVRKHPRGSYVGLTLTSLLAELRRTGAQYLVLAGEHAVQSTATIAPDLEAHPAFQERHVVRTPADGIEVYIYAVEGARLSDPGAAPHLWLDAAAFNALLRDIPRARLGWSAARVVEELGGERVAIAPLDGSGLLAAEQLRTLRP